MDEIMCSSSAFPTRLEEDSARRSLGRREVLRLLAERSAQQLANLMGLVVADPVSRSFYGQLYRYAQTDLPILLYAERGSGKTESGLFIHLASHRLQYPYFAVNVSAVPSSLFESEFFGHEPRSFSDANERRGLMRTAKGGTLLLDEVGMLAPEVQPKLLRALEVGAVRPVGRDEEVPVDVRLLFATNRNLDKLVDEERFLPDLRDRIASIPLTLPPLRERPVDIPLIVDHIMRECAVSLHTLPIEFTESAMKVFVAYPWPGNVRELRSAVLALMVEAEGSPVDDTDVARWLARHRDPPTRESPPTLRPRGRTVDPSMIVNALIASGGRPAVAARIAGVSRSTFYNRFTAEELATIRAQSSRR